MASSIANRREYGAEIIKRAKEMKIPSGLRSPLGRFTKIHGLYEKSSQKADGARVKHEASLAVLAAADAELDKTLEPLAAKMVGEQVTRSMSPLKGFSKYSPSDLMGMKYSDENREVGSLLTKLGAVIAKFPSIAKVARETRKRLLVSKAAIDALTGPQSAWTKALSEREGLLGEWEAALHSVRVQGAAAWEKTPAMLKALLAPVEATQQGTKKVASSGKKKPSKKKKSPGSSGNKPPPTPAAGGTSG